MAADEPVRSSPSTVAGPAITTVLFDYSGVLTTPLSLPDDPPFDVDALLTFMAPGLMGEDPHPWHELERGEITIDAWIEMVEATAPGGGVMFDPASPHNAMARLELRHDHLQLAQTLSDAGVSVGLLTNNVAEWRSLWLDRLPEGLFAAVIDSSEVGMRKPESRIYQLAMAELEATIPSAVLMIDDFEWNITGAAKLGLSTVHCTPETDLEAELHQLRLLP